MFLIKRSFGNVDGMYSVYQIPLMSKTGKNNEPWSCFTKLTICPEPPRRGYLAGWAVHWFSNQRFYPDKKIKQSSSMDSYLSLPNAGGTETWQDGLLGLNHESGVLVCLRALISGSASVARNATRLGRVLRSAGEQDLRSLPREKRSGGAPESRRRCNIATYAKVYACA